MAGRKNKYTVDYFPHYCNGESKTMFILENKFGLVGYAIWYKTLELLGKSDYHYIDLRNETDMLFLISKLRITVEKFIEIYDLLAKLDAIDLDLWNHNIIFSDNFVSNIEDAYVRRKGINVLHKLDLCKHLSIKCSHKLPNESKVKESKEDEEDVLFTIDKLKERYLSDEDLVSAVSQTLNTNHGEIEKKLTAFNEHLKSTGINSKKWLDYTSHFLNYERKKKEKSSAKKEKGKAESILEAIREAKRM